jgi:hypothetical protein
MINRKRETNCLHRTCALDQSFFHYFWITVFVYVMICVTLLCAKSTETKAQPDVSFTRTTVAFVAFVAMLPCASMVVLTIGMTLVML